MSKKQLNSRESLFLSINLNLDVQASLDKISYRKHSVVASALNIIGIIFAVVIIILD